MPEFRLPPFDYSENKNGTVVEFSLGSALKEKTSALIVIPLIAFMEHITITKAFAGTDKVDANQELLCVGVANLIGSFFSSVPVTGAFGRTALNHASGAQSPLGGFLTGAIVILALVVLTPQFYFIPKATLNSVVVMAVIFMVDFDILVSIWKSKSKYTDKQANALLPHSNTRVTIRIDITRIGSSSVAGDFLG
jgi:sodium-independent sulfate anion transporter 11